MGLRWSIPEAHFSPEFSGLMETVSDIDPLFSPGSLLLTEPMHPLGAWPAGVPDSGSWLPNVVYDNAVEILGAPTQGRHDVALSYTAYEGEIPGDVRRTAKGGLHASYSTEPVGAGNGLSLLVPNSGMWTHIVKSGHRFYYSLWAKRTRIADASVGSTVIGMLATGTAFLGGFAPEVTLISDPEGRGRPATNELGFTFRNVGASSLPLRGTAEAAWTDNHSLFTIGNRPSPNRTASRLGKGGAGIFYRAYVEDLTISGRSYERVDALDYALYTKHILTPGGRYYGDDEG